MKRKERIFPSVVTFSFLLQLEWKKGRKWAKLSIASTVGFLPSLRDTQLFVCTTIFILTCNQKHSGFYLFLLTRCTLTIGIYHVFVRGHAGFDPTVVRSADFWICTNNVVKGIHLKMNEYTTVATGSKAGEEKKSWKKHFYIVVAFVA